MNRLRDDAEAALSQDDAAQARYILDRLATRASCRDFDGSDISPDILEDIVRDGVEAPSSCNQQNWHFIIVADPARKARARDISGGNHHFAECSALIYLCFQKGWTHGNFSIVQSVAGACYHMMLSAHLRGFQCIWNAGIGDHTALRQMLGLPATFDVIGALAIGRAKTTAPKIKAPRRPVSEIFSWEEFARPAASCYPVKAAADYPYWEIRNDANPYAEWNPAQWRWDQLADFRGYSVWAKSPLAGVYVSRRQGEATAVELSLIPTLPKGARVVEVMGWGGTSTTALLGALAADARLTVAELSANNLSFIMERLRREGHAMDRVTGVVMAQGKLPQPDASVDLVVLPQVLEHMPDPQAFLDEVRRVLAPGGHVLVSIRNMSSAYGAHWRAVEAKAAIPNQGPFTPIAAADLAAWMGARFAIEEDLGIGADATGDAVRLTGSACQSGRLYVMRATRG